jgi:hypothetical protein
LNRGYLVDLVIVGDAFVIHRHDTINFVLPHPLEYLQTDMPVQEDVLFGSACLGINNDRLDDADLLDRGFYSPIPFGSVDSRTEFPGGQDVAQRD